MSDTKQQDPELKKLEQQMAALSDKMKRRKAKLASDERKRDTRRKVLVGAAMTKAAMSDPTLRDRIHDELNTQLTKPGDRELFDLPKIASPQAANDGGGEISTTSSIAS